ncbi:50S ribosomal protein L11 methyltransferase [Rhizorhapis sp. SPR117]|uniref:50S ribosomal protein L11 methyltransferase n=1 Tax=Rhizorhapis sp. SPR117 TaxID=2912611 RepID=UPI001F3295AB|nr:50S ribosomal protein L11 methyltransferase [Rhizorhapis sp. SPR117]
MQRQNSESWKLTLPCTRAEADALALEIEPLALMHPPPALMTSEPDESRPNEWRLEAYFEGKPNTATIRAICALVPSARNTKPTLEKLPDEDWVTLSQRGLEPVIAGRFFVHNMPDDVVPEGRKAFLIGAGQAFGTGQHETTKGCLLMLDRMRRLGGRFDTICDIGTGTGILAFAAMHLWPRAYATASDIDPVAVAVTAENAEVNDVPLGLGPGKVALVTAAGADHPVIARRAPHDLVIANILAGPLIELAPSLAAILPVGGTLILAGLLDSQTDRVVAAYRREGLRLADRIDNGQWPTLRLRKRKTIGWKRPKRLRIGHNGEAPGFGSW